MADRVQFFNPDGVALAPVDLALVAKEHPDAFSAAIHTRDLAAFAAITPSRAPAPKHPTVMYKGSELNISDLKVTNDHKGHIVIFLRGDVLSTIEESGSARQVTLYRDGSPSSRFEMPRPWAATNSANDVVDPQSCDEYSEEECSGCLSHYWDLAAHLTLALAAEAGVLGACALYFGTGGWITPVGGACAIALAGWDTEIGDYLDTCDWLEENCPSWFTTPFFCWDGTGITGYHWC